MRIRFLLVLVLAMALALSACSPPSEDTNGTAEEEAQTTEAEPAATESDVITLPDGWEMEEAISAEEVGEVTGETMKFFPLPGAKGENGYPSCEYMIADVGGSGIRFSGRVEGGEGVYEVLHQYAVDGGVTEVDGLGDRAHMVEIKDGDFAIVALKGDSRYEIRWDPSFYSVEKDKMGRELMAKLLSNVYGF